MSERVVAAAAPWIAASFVAMVVWVGGAALFGWDFNAVSLVTILLLVVAALRALVVAARREEARRAE